MNVLDLVALAPHGPEVVTKAIYVQQFARDRLGHILELHTERTWRDLKDAAQGSAQKGVRVTCYRCGAVGLLDEWYLLLGSCCGQWAIYVDHSPSAQIDRLMAMQERCTAILHFDAMEYARVMEDL